MKRLTYSPRTEVYVKADSGIHDISPYITEVDIDRKVNQVSSARVVFRNPSMMFTEHKYTDPITNKEVVGPLFHPMDPITITLTRIKNRPIQVFTGYCDKTPYLQLFPGPCVIEASCTLKRLQYTYWDPGLPFVWEFMGLHGWQPSPTGIEKANAESVGLRTGNNVNPENPLQDSGFGELLLGVLTEIGGWNKNNIFIEPLPSDIVDLVTGLFEMFKQDSEQATQELQDLLHKIIGTSTLGGGDPGGSGVAGGGSATDLPGGTPAKNQALGHQMMLDHGFPESEWESLKTLWTNESGWDEDAQNPSSPAYGIPQSIHPNSDYPMGGRPGDPNGTQKARIQIKWGLNYIKDRYRTPTRALSFWNAQSPHWY